MESETTKCLKINIRLVTNMFVMLQLNIYFAVSANFALPSMEVVIDVLLIVSLMNIFSLFCIQRQKNCVTKLNTCAEAKEKT